MHWQFLIKKLLKTEQQNVYIKDKCACKEDIKYTYECKVKFWFGTQIFQINVCFHIWNYII